MRLDRKEEWRRRNEGWLRGWHASNTANGAPMKRAQTEAKQWRQMLNHNYKNAHTCNNNIHNPLLYINQLKHFLSHLRCLPKDFWILTIIGNEVKIYSGIVWGFWYKHQINSQAEQKRKSCVLSLLEWSCMQVSHWYKNYFLFSRKQTQYWQRKNSTNIQSQVTAICPLTDAFHPAGTYRNCNCNEPLR